MTEIREPTVEEQVAKGNPHGPMPSDKRMAWNEGAKFVLAIPEIKEGQELREKAKILHGHGGVADQIRQCLAGAGADMGSLSLGDKFAKDRLGAWLQRIQVEVLRIESLASGESR